MGLSTREISVLVWSLVAFLCVASVPSVRAALLNVLKAATHRKILALLGLLAAYAAAEVYLLHTASVWKPAFLKTTLLWFVFTGISSGSGALSGFKSPSYSKPVRDGLHVMVLAELLIGLTTFSLSVELVLVPFATFVVLLASFAELKQKGEPVQRFLAGVQTLLGLTVLTIAVLRVSHQYASLANADALVEFLLPPLLSVMFIPAMFAAVVYARYDWLFLKLQGEASFRRRAKWRLVT